MNFECNGLGIERAGAERNKNEIQRIDSHESAAFR